MTKTPVFLRTGVHSTESMTKRDYLLLPAFLTLVFRPLPILT